MLFVAPPDEAARAEILRLQLKGKPQDAIDIALFFVDDDIPDGLGYLTAAVTDAVTDQTLSPVCGHQSMAMADMVEVAMTPAHLPIAFEFFEIGVLTALAAGQRYFYDQLFVFGVPVAGPQGSPADHYFISESQRCVGIGWAGCGFHRSG